MKSEKFHSGSIWEQQMIVSSMNTEQQLPTELPAKIHYVCKSKTKAGNMQAKCSYLYNKREYQGIVFAPDNEDWFKDLTPGTIIKARRVELGNHPDFPGDLKGDALRLTQQDALTSTTANPLSTLPDLLRQTADLIERLTGQIQETNQTVSFEPELKYRSQQDWANIIESILMTVPSFHKAFSAIMLNAYIESTFDDFWPGDTIVLKKGPRWKAATARALVLLIDYGSIQRIKGTSHHYELTESMRSKLSQNK